MNREILFRGKRKSDEHWIYGYVNADNRGVTIKFIENNFYKEIPVIPETVGQYIGLTDKNDKKIFEGDILQDCLFVGKVVYNKTLAAFIVEINDSTENWYHWSPLNKGDIDRKSKLQYTKVIGNIHSNPELLEVAE